MFCNVHLFETRSRDFDIARVESTAAGVGNCTACHETGCRDVNRRKAVPRGCVGVRVVRDIVCHINYSPDVCINISFHTVNRPRRPLHAPGTTDDNPGNDSEMARRMEEACRNRLCGIDGGDEDMMRGGEPGLIDWWVLEMRPMGRVEGEQSNGGRGGH